MKSNVYNYVSVKNYVTIAILPVMAVSDSRLKHEANRLYDKIKNSKKLTKNDNSTLAKLTKNYLFMYRYKMDKETMTVTVYTYMLFSKNNGNSIYGDKTKYDFIRITDILK
jgi:uncharacterized protein YnzC (UPF0291/DUF896 family)